MDDIVNPTLLRARDFIKAGPKPMVKHQNIIKTEKWIVRQRTNISIHSLLNIETIY